ncbi:MAG TPA: hypothetical protein GX518_05925 [Firmicutes bacterium]|jgi:hypothetical protein|nr:hypothetical protein [Bacillota bacterium]
MSDEKKVEQKGSQARDFFLTGLNRFKQEVVEINQDGKALKVLIKEPNARQRGEIFKAATKIKKSGDAEIDHAELQVWAVIFCAYDAQTGEALFEPAHHDVLLSLPTSVFDLLAKPAMAMLGENPEEVAGN